MNGITFVIIGLILVASGLFNINDDFGIGMTFCCVGGLLTGIGFGKIQHGK